MREPKREWVFNKDWGAWVLMSDGVEVVGNEDPIEATKCYPLVDGKQAFEITTTHGTLSHVTKIDIDDLISQLKAAKECL